MPRPRVQHIKEGEQTCRRCKISKILDSFWKDRGKETGYSQYCKKCSNIHRKECRDRIKTGTTKFKVGLYKKGTKEYKNHQKDIQLRYNYGTTLKEYNTLFSIQNGCCCICNIHQNSLKKPLGIDHSHKTGKIRGLLCSNCNTALGLLKENLKSLEKAHYYLLTSEKNNLENLASIILN